MGWEDDFTLAIVFGPAPRCTDRVALMALRGVVISTIRKTRYQVTQNAAGPPGEGGEAILKGNYGILEAQ